MKSLSLCNLQLFISWLGEEDSNPRKQVQSLSSYHWTIPQALRPKHYIQNPRGCQG